MIALWTLWACSGGAPDCDGLSGEALDSCHTERSRALLGQDPAAALDAARAIADPIARDLALIAVLTTPGALPDAEVRAVCERELQAASHRDQCRRYIERPHLRADQRGPASAGAVDCAADPEGDGCRYERALGQANGPVAELERTLSGIQSAEIRGQALAGALRQRQARDLSELRQLAGLLPLAEGLYRAEAASWLGAEMPMRLLRDCERTGDPARCSAMLTGEVIPFSAEICSQAGELGEQCFDHVCMALAARSLDAGMTLAPGPLAARVQADHAAAVAIEPRVASIPGCHAIWLGRKLAQRSVELHWVDERCAAMGPDADRCRSGAAEELVSRQLRAQPVRDPAALEALVTTGADAFAAPPALRTMLPCGAFSVLSGRLDPALSGQKLDPALLERLHSASPGCAWSDAP